MSPAKLLAVLPGPRPTDPPPALLGSEATSEVRPVAARVAETPPEPVDPELAWLDAQLAAELDVAEESDAPDTERHPTSLPPPR